MILNPISFIWLKMRQRVVKKEILKLTNNKIKKLKILDVGCGPNKLFSWSTGLDIKKFNGVNIVSSIEKAKISKDTFDYVLILEVLEHLQNPDEALKKVQKSLKSNGILLLTTPSNTSLWKFIWFCWSNTFGLKWKKTHINNFDKVSIIKLISKYFRIIKISKVNIFLLFIEAMKK